MQNTGVLGRFTLPQYTKLWIWSLHDYSLGSFHGYTDTWARQGYMRLQLLDIRKRIPNWRQKNIRFKNVMFQRVIYIAKVQFKIKQKLYEKQSLRQGWHSLSCHRGCCTDICHFNVWAVFLSCRMEALSAVAVPRSQTKGSMGYKPPKGSAVKNGGLPEKAVQNTYSMLLLKVSASGKVFVSCGICIFPSFVISCE